MEHPIGELMQTAMASIKDMVDVNTVVGEPVTAPGDTTIIPISKVSFGYVTAGGDLSTHEKPRRPEPIAPVEFPFAGGSGAGVSVQPVGFLVVSGGTGTPGSCVRMIPAACGSVADRMVELIPTVMEDVKGLIDKRRAPMA